MTDLDRLEELPVEPSNAEQAEWPDATRDYVRGLETQLRQLREIVREAGEVLEPFVTGAAHTQVFLGSREKMHSCGLELYQADVNAARTLHNKIKEVMG